MHDCEKDTKKSHREIQENRAESVVNCSCSTSRLSLISEQSIKTISINKLTESTHHVNKSEMKEKMNSQSCKSDNYHIKYCLKAVSSLFLWRSFQT